MTDTTFDILELVDHEDMGDALAAIERSFGIAFEPNELRPPWTFGQLCDLVALKMSGNDQNDCTSQQAFYKLRAALIELPSAENLTISPGTLLSDVLPRTTRISDVKALDLKLGIKTYLLRPKHWIVNTTILLFLGSFILLFFRVGLALAGFLASIAIVILSERFSRELKYDNVGELSNRLSEVHYRKFRRDPSTVNRREIEDKIRSLFIVGFSLGEDDAASLTRESRFG